MSRKRSDDDAEEDDDDFGDFINAPSHSSQPITMHSTDNFAHNNHDDDDFGDFTAAPLSTTTHTKDQSLFPEYPPTVDLFHSDNAVYEEPPSVTSLFPDSDNDAYKTVNGVTDLLQKQSSLLILTEESQKNNSYGTTTATPNITQDIHAETGISNTVESRYDTFPSIATEEYQNSYSTNEIQNKESIETSSEPFHPTDSDDQFDFARPPPTLKAVADVDFSDAMPDSSTMTSSSMSDIVEIPKLPPPKSQMTTTTTTTTEINLLDIQPPKPEDANLLELPAPQSRSTSSLTNNEINFFDNLVHPPTVTSTTIDNNLQNFAIPLSSAPVDKETSQSLKESVVTCPHPSQLDRRPCVDDDEKLDQHGIEEEEEWGEFTGFVQNVDSTAAPEGREAKKFVITAASPNRFSFYNPSEEDKLEAFSSTVPDEPTKQQIVGEVKKSSQLPNIATASSVHKVTAVETDAFASLSAENHLNEIEALRRQLMEQKKEASQRIHALQVQHAKATADVRIEANRKAKEYQQAEIERLCRSLEVAESSSKKAREQLLEYRSQMNALNEKHAQELHERDLMLKRIRSETEDSVRREMHSNLRERETMHVDSEKYPDPRQEGDGVVKLEAENTKDKRASSFCAAPKKECYNKEKFSLQAEILSLKQKLEKAQKLVDSQSTQARDSLLNKEEKISELQEELKNVKESLASKENELKSFASKSVNETIEWEAQYKSLLEDSTSEKLHLKSQIEEIRKSEQTLRINEARLARRAEHLEKQLETSAESIASAYRSESAMEELLQKERVDFNERYSLLKTEWTAERDGLERSINQLSSLVSEKEQALEKLQATAKEERETIRTLSRNEIKLQQVVQRLQKAIEKSADEVKLRDRIIEGLRQDLLERDGVFATLEKELEEEREKDRSQGQKKVNLNYLKDVVVKYLSHPPGSSERAQLLPVLATLLEFDSADYKIIEAGKQKLSWWGSVNPTII
jgi:hypothetical protein